MIECLGQGHSRVGFLGQESANEVDTYKSVITVVLWFEQHT
jgi:hypothetical protein